MNSNDPARGFFAASMTDRERAAFEAGIALASSYHRLLGMPLTRKKEVLQAIKGAIEATSKLQPFREHFEVKFEPDQIAEGGSGPYSYSELGPSQIQLAVKIRYGSARVLARMRFVEEIRYPLMFVERFEEVR